MADPKTIVRTAGIDWTKAWRGRHPYNPNSEVRMFGLSRMAGMERVPLNLIRVGPGRETFVPHAHAVEEEWVFILEGAGTLSLDGVDHAVGPGDYIGFPIDGVVHQIRNTGDEDLVYLTGGERTKVEVADMPSLGKVAVFAHGVVTLYDPKGAEKITLEEWMRRATLPGEDG
jgi:uncharacterized cupin superfamily protein